MKFKIIAVLGLFVVALVGFYFGTTAIQTDTEDERAQVEVASVKQEDQNYNNKNIKVSRHSPSRSIASIKREEVVSIQMQDKFYAQNPYWQKIKNDLGVSYLYSKSLKAFKGSPQAEDLAVWISMGMLFDSSQEYGELLNHSMDALNENKDEVYDFITESVDNLQPEDNFLRGQLLNMVNGLEVGSKRKVDFFGKEASRKVVLDERGRFSPDSLNITTSMALLKQSVQTEEQARRFIKRSLEKNQNQQIRQKLIVRFSSYFPTLKGEFER
ncbi:MAG: hypothetical protein ISR65_12025 [Bacteriovoracaceae bacterium]|nr:hypothetical protein [Candidatus Brocadiales bacterium]MBL6990503.1 hypothetical protein [Bacteriovoracaceae bacterium]